MRKDKLEIGSKVGQGYEYETQDVCRRICPSDVDPRPQRLPRREREGSGSARPEGPGWRADVPGGLVPAEEAIAEQLPFWLGWWGLCGFAGPHLGCFASENPRDG